MVLFFNFYKTFTFWKKEINIQSLYYGCKEKGEIKNE